MRADPGRAGALPSVVDLVPGEALDGYLERVAEANYLSTAQLVRLVRAAGDTTAYLMLAPTPSTLTAIADLTGSTAHDLHLATLAVYDGTAVDLTGLDPTRPASFRAVSARGWVPGHGTQLCSACLAEDGIWRVVWRLPTTTVCMRHGVYLLATCPGCHRRFRDQRHSPLRVIGAEPRCGNPLGQGPRKQCPVDLTTLTSQNADPECVTRQARQDAADAGAATTTFTGDLGPGEYSATVRSLAVLLMHIGTAAEPQNLPAWVSDLRAELTPGVRRWSIRPPQSPALRSRALTSADEILAAADLGAAVARVAPWLDGVPEIPEGGLGWLADHTRMTATLTHLLMAAHAPRRRLSRLLDQVPPLTSSTRGIPQVLPAQVVQAHLAALFDSRPATVGLFASLCLARSHPDVNSWAAAAETLGIDPDRGERAARVCSASQTGSPQEVLRVLESAARDLDIDYRDLEDHIRHLARNSDWFTDWARAHRPGTRGASHPHAVRWLWTQAAHAHPSTTPSATAPAGARKFERSLTSEQAHSLAAVMLVPAHPDEEDR